MDFRPSDFFHEKAGTGTRPRPGSGMDRHMSFTRRILVTGASDGIGGATCRRFAEDVEKTGGRLGLVLTTSGTKPPPASLIEALQASGAGVLHIEGDIADPDICNGVVARTLEFLGGLDVLISNAGGVSPGPLADIPLASWDRLFDLDTRPTWLFARGLREALAESRGSIVAVGSTSGLHPHVGHGAYSAAKAALTMLIRQLAQEWASLGIRSNMVAPGLIETPLTAGVYADLELRKRREDAVPLGRIGRPEDVAEAIFYLASPAASYVTGQVLAIDGGIADAALLRVAGLPAGPK